jgi:hypothetical protein
MELSGSVLRGDRQIAIRGVAPFYSLPAGLGKRTWQARGEADFELPAAIGGSRARANLERRGICSWALEITFEGSDRALSAASRSAYSRGIRALATIDKLSSVHRPLWPVPNLPLQTGHAMLKCQNKGSAWPGVRAHSAAKAWQSGGSFRRDCHMKFNHIVGLLCAASVSVIIAAPASAQDTVKIGR